MKEPVSLCVDLLSLVRAAYERYLSPASKLGNPTAVVGMTRAKEVKACNSQGEYRVRRVQEMLGVTAEVLPPSRSLTTSIP